jgi:hypothetical protein
VLAGLSPDKRRNRTSGIEPKADGLLQTITSTTYTLQMNRRVLAFGISVELLTSFWLYTTAPTDGVRVWYPSLWAYVGEHALVWGILIAVLFALFRKKSSSEVLTASACVVSELVSTLYVWFVIPSEGDVSRAWYTGRFSDYFRMRLTTWCVLAASASTVYWFRYKKVPKRTQVPG